MTGWCARKHFTSKPLNSITKYAIRYKKKQLNIPEAANTKSTTDVEDANVVYKKAARLKKCKTIGKGKPLHGQFVNRVLQADVYTEKTFHWFRNSTLKAKTKGFILATKDQNLKTRHYT